MVAEGLAEGLRPAPKARAEGAPKKKWPFPPRNRYHMDRNRYHMDRNRYHMDRNRYHMDRTATIWAERRLRRAPSAQ